MDKQQALAFIKSQIDSGTVTEKDLANLVGASSFTNIPGVPSSARPPLSSSAASYGHEEKSKNLINTFYAIGAVIVVIGVIILLVQHWDEIGFAGQMLVTLGLSFASYVVALFLRKPDQEMISQVFFTISAALAPIGAAVYCNEAGINMGDWGVQIVMSLIFFFIYLCAYFVSRRNILVFVSTAFATWTYYAIIFNILDSAAMRGNEGDFLQWATIILGICYMILGHHFSPLRKFFYSVGALGILGAGITIGGAFDLFYIVFIFAAFYGSVYLKSKEMLGLGAMFLIAHLIKLTSEYFADSVGWPVALVFVGFAVIGIGYVTLYLNRKFIKVA